MLYGKMPKNGDKLSILDFGCIRFLSKNSEGKTAVKALLVICLESAMFVEIAQSALWAGCQRLNH